MLYANDRGCPAPGCTVPGYYCEVHHITDYATCRSSDTPNLTFACGAHHRLLRPGGWTTLKRANGHTHWIPPPYLDQSMSGAPARVRIVFRSVPAKNRGNERLSDPGGRH